jgi:FtsH-binding integral membrane protein
MKSLVKLFVLLAFLYLSVDCRKAENTLYLPAPHPKFTLRSTPKPYILAHFVVIHPLLVPMIPLLFIEIKSSCSLLHRLTKHRHIFMETLVQIHLILHITAGISTLIAGPIAIFYNFKNVKNHRLAGQIFAYSMMYVCASAVLGYLRRPDMLFYQFLFGIAILVASDVIRGIRAIKMMKGNPIKQFDYWNASGLLLLGIWMLWCAVQHLPEGGFVPILFAVFGVGATMGAITDWRRLNRTDLVPMDHYLQHIGSMFGAFTASTTAFMVNIASDTLPWYVVWFAPTFLFVPLRIYFSRKVKNGRKPVLA